MTRSGAAAQAGGAARCVAVRRALARKHGRARDGRGRGGRASFRSIWRVPAPSSCSPVGEVERLARIDLTATSMPVGRWRARWTLLLLPRPSSRPTSRSSWRIDGAGLIRPADDKAVPLVRLFGEKRSEGGLIGPFGDSTRPARWHLVLRGAYHAWSRSEQKGGIVSAVAVIARGSAGSPFRPITKSSARVSEPELERLVGLTTSQ